MRKDILNIIKKDQKKSLPIIKKYIKRKTLLDVGCGNAINSFLFNKKYKTKVTLLDKQDIREKEEISFPFFLGSIDKIPFDQDSFDVVFVQYVLHHLSSEIKLEKSLKELKRVGRIIIIIEEIIGKKTNLEIAKHFDEKTNKIMNPGSKTPVNKYYKDEELKKLFNLTGLKIIEEKIIDKGCKINGYLERKVYIISP